MGRKFTTSKQLLQSDLRQKCKNKTYRRDRVLKAIIAMDMKADVNRLMISIADVRERCKSVKECPECKSGQVQLVAWFSQPCKFKCRHCKHKFEVSV